MTTHTKRVLTDGMRKGVSYILLTCLTLVFLLPFFWMLSTAFKTPAQLYLDPPVWIPDPITLDNFIKGWDYVDFNRYVLNTLFITIVGTLGTVVTSALVAYGFARFPSRWNGPLFTIVLATLMLPSQVTLIPAYMMYSKLGFVDTYLPLLLPAWLGGGAFNIFLLRQFIRGIPHELDEAAEIDGCGTFKIFYKILLPAMKPVLTTVGVMALIGNWNDFMGPLIYLNSESKYTLAIGLQFFNQNFGTGKMNYLMAVSILTTLPLIILFFCAQRYFVQGITMSGIKG